MNLFEVEKLKRRLEDLEKETLKEDFWSNDNSKILQEIKILKDNINSYNKIYNEIQNCIEMNNLLVLEEDKEILQELLEDTKRIRKDIESLEIKTLLSGKYDMNNAIVSMHPGAGGTESQDWVEMLYRMYSRYAEKNGYSITLLDRQDGEEAGIKSIMFQVDGTFAYGYLKGEKGVHRLVRISPFDANKRRHTSFAAVDVIPEIDNDIEVNVNDSDIRVDIYRSSGPGGQGVNTTDSAVRITHIPTGIVVTCQNERSQIRNKEKAMEVLKSKLYTILLEEKKSEVSDIRGVQVSNGFGSAKRSYVMQPYRLIKDNDSGYESSDVDGILDGNITDMLDYNLKNKKE